MADEMMTRMDQLREQSLETAFEMPEKFEQEYVQRYLRTMLDESRKSIAFLQESLTVLSNLRDKYPNDLELGQLIWDNIQPTHDCIRQEMWTINEIRQEAKNARKEER